jgi:branched-chain amino acid transport system permease protein
MLSSSIQIFGFVIGVNKLAAIVATVVMLIFLDWFMKFQKTGIAMRAAAEDFAIARLMGIRANTVIAGAFALSGLLAGVAAVLWVSQRASVDPLMGFMPVLKAFIAAILGGLGSLRGAVAGGFLLGFIEIYLAAFLPPEMQEFRDPISLGIVVLVLLFRPNGLIPSATLKAEKV